MNVAHFYKNFQESNPERFNEDLIFMRKEETSLCDVFFKNLFSSLSIPGVTFVESEIVTNELEQVKYLPPVTLRSIEESRLDLVRAKFILEAEGEKKEYEFLQYFPKLVDDFFFELIGNRYYCIYQLNDKNFYSTSKALYLKTLLMPLGIKFSKFSFETTKGNDVSGLEYLLDIFRAKSLSEVKNMFLYFFIEYGEEAIDYIFNYKVKEGEEPLVFFEDTLEDYEGFDSYQVRKDFFIYFKENLLEEDPNFKNLVCTLVASLKGVRKSKEALFEDVNYLKKRILGTTNPNTAKADKAMLSLKRILDKVTIDKLKHLPEEEKEDTFAIVRYMTWNFSTLFQLDTVDLANRRLRLFEYMVYPLLTKLSDATYRILNSRNVTMKRLTGVFSTIHPYFIVKNLVNNELLRYYNATSTLELFTTVLRYSSKGPQALGSSGQGVAIKYRAVHPSYVGVFGLTMSSADEPGLTGTFCPLTKKIQNFEFVNTL